MGHDPDTCTDPQCFNCKIKSLRFGGLNAAKANKDRTVKESREAGVTAVPYIPGRDNG